MNSFEERNSVETKKPKRLFRKLTQIVLFFLRFASLLFANLKVIWMGIQLSIICTISYSVEATGVSTDCNWYWGEFAQYNDDDYVNSIAISQNSNGPLLKMTCANATCASVCPGDCKTTYWYGDTGMGSLINNTKLNYCTIIFNYLNLVFGFTIMTLSVDAFIQLIIGYHMVYYNYFRSKSSNSSKANWWFVRNLHNRSVFTSLIYAFRPGLMLKFLLDPSELMYPELPDVTPVPYMFKLIFAILVDIPYAIASILWALYVGDSLSIFLAIASSANVTIGFLWNYYLQFRMDIVGLFPDDSNEEDDQDGDTEARVSASKERDGSRVFGSKAYNIDIGEVSKDAELQEGLLASPVI